MLKDLDEEVQNGYYGMLVDIFKCEPLLYRAVEQAAGNKLFDHVVENKYVATKIIQEINWCLHLPKYQYVSLAWQLTPPLCRSTVVVQWVVGCLGVVCCVAAFFGSTCCGAAYCSAACCWCNLLWCSLLLVQPVLVQPLIVQSVAV